MIYVVYIAVGIALILIINGLIQPSQFNVRRSISINAEPSKVYPLIEDLKQWDKWSPWAEKDPTMRKVYSEPSNGVGAEFAWDGNKQVGKGRMTIVGVETNQSVSIRLQIEAPVSAQNQVKLSLEPQNSSTNTSWEMRGSQNFLMRAMSLFFSMDKMVGKDFECGLRSLKALAED